MTLKVVREWPEDFGETVLGQGVTQFRKSHLEVFVTIMRQAADHGPLTLTNLNHKSSVESTRGKRYVKLLEKHGFLEGHFDRKVFKQERRKVSRHKQYSITNRGLKVVRMYQRILHLLNGGE